MDDEALARFAFGPTKDENGRDIATRGAEPDQEDVLRTNRSAPKCAVFERFWRCYDQIGPSAIVSAGFNWWSLGLFW
jgi:hypothetical protein